MELINKRKPYPNRDQKQKLVDLVQADPELCSGKFTRTYTKKEGEIRWKNIAEQCNAVNGAKKTWIDWRKTWQDMKKKTKKKQSIIRRSTNSTGGGPPPDPLSFEEMQILETISESAISGHCDSQESIVNFIDLKQPQMPPAVPAAAATLLATVSLQSHSGQNFMPPVNELEEIFELNDENAENQPKKKRTASQKRLSRSLDVATNLEKVLKEKNEIKRQFYKEYIYEIKQQTRALMQIAHGLKSGSNQLDHDYS